MATKPVWLPLRLVRPGRTFKYKGVNYIRIQQVSLISKNTVNLLHLPTGELGYLDMETAVQIKKTK